MSNETKQMGAEEFYQDCAFLVPYPKGRNIAVVTVDDAYQKMQEQTAALREELDKKKRILHDIEAEKGETIRAYEDLKSWSTHIEKELEAVKRERDEAVKLLREYGRKKSEADEREWHRRYIDFLRRISSGETKPPEIPDSSTPH